METIIAWMEPDVCGNQFEFQLVALCSTGIDDALLYINIVRKLLHKCLVLACSQLHQSTMWINGEGSLESRPQ